jgi:1-acyl-sn-glycerol-3-phosphate acyltransferase
MRQALKWIVGVVTGVLSFVYLIFVLNVVQMLSLLLVPFSRSAVREINRWCSRSIWGLWVIMAEAQNGTKVRFTGDAIVPRENMLVLPNHQTMADVLALLCFAWRAGRIGDLKWFVKDIIKWFPGFGWGMWLLDCVFVKRDWAQDKRHIHRLFDKYRKNRIPLCLVTFLEGTRKTEDKHAAARAYAEERGLHVPQHTLVPRVKGFLATMEGLSDHLDAVYDVTIAYPGRIPSLVNCYEARCPRIDIHVRRYAIASLPKDEAALTEWALARFREKDELLAAWHRDGRFPGAEHDAPIRVMDWFLPEARLAARAAGAGSTPPTRHLVGEHPPMPPPTRP